MKKIKEAVKLFDNGDTRSFNEIYAGKEDLFEDIDDIISPKMKKLFESVYANTSVQKLNEEVLAKDNPHHNFTGGEGDPKSDGVSNAHNPALNKGATSEVTQSGQDYSSNPALFEAMKDIFEKAQLKESFDDFDDDEEFEFDAASEDVKIDDEFEGEDSLDFNDGSLDDLDDDDDFYEDYDDGSFVEGSYDNMKLSNDEFDIED
jgi:hypothetical protein